MIWEEYPHRCPLGLVNPSDKVQAVRPSPQVQANLLRSHPSHDFLNGSSSGHSVPSASNPATTSSSLITAEQARDLVEDLNALLTGKFQTDCALDDNPEKDRLHPKIWRIVNVDVALGTYGAVFPDIPDRIVVTKEKFIEFLTDSKRVD